jgi:hypothetical protein
MSKEFSKQQEQPIAAPQAATTETTQPFTNGRRDFIRQFTALVALTCLSPGIPACSETKEGKEAQSTEHIKKFLESLSEDNLDLENLPLSVTLETATKLATEVEEKTNHSFEINSDINSEKGWELKSARPRTFESSIFALKAEKPITIEGKEFILRFQASRIAPGHENSEWSDMTVNLVLPGENQPNGEEILTWGAGKRVDENSEPSESPKYIVTTFSEIHDMKTAKECGYEPPTVLGAE